MKTLKKMSLFLIVGGGMASALFGSKVQAAEEEESANKTAETTTSFSLEAGDDETIPGIIDPEVKPPTNQKGKLTINAVSNIVFPNTKLGNESGAPIKAQVPVGEKLGVQITDIRGTGAGWKLAVAATEFQNAEKTLTLRGAKVTIPGTGNTVTEEGNDLTFEPTSQKVVLGPDKNILLSATKDKGLGKWLHYFENDSDKVTIEIPSGNKVATYISDLTWTLEDAP